MATFVYSEFQLGIVCNGCNGEYDLRLNKDKPQQFVWCPYCRNHYEVKKIDESYGLFEIEE